MSAHQPPLFFDVLVVGGGAAGLYAALCLPSHLSVGLITKDTLALSASDWAQGGIAAAIAPEDSPTLHYQDTLKAGVGLCEPQAVQFLVDHASRCIERLVELGVAFDRKQSGQLALTLEAAHSRHRVLHAADTTGHALVSTLAAQVLQRSNVHVLSDVFVLDLWLNPHTQACQGVMVAQHNQVTWIAAQAVVLATGGGGQVYAHTTNPAGSTGDGLAIAWRAGAEVRDLEFFQFHPTALMKAGAPRFLISEAVRGEGAHLVDHQGYRFAFDHHPQGELAPRDIVSRAIFNHLQTQDPEIHAVGLDLRPIPPDILKHRFPNIIKVCQHWGINPLDMPIPVAPAAHYWMGGITTNLDSQTTIPGLYALGETASTGIHGANRLASNSLLECIVFGQTMAALDLKPHPYTEISISMAAEPAITISEPQTSALDLMQYIAQQLPQLMWNSAGICRCSVDLETAHAQVEQWREAFRELPISQHIQALKSSTTGLQVSSSELSLRAWGEINNLLDNAALILTSSRFRTESRGGHYRSDYPQPLPEWRVHTIIQENQLQRSSLICDPSPPVEGISPV